MHSMEYFRSPAHMAEVTILQSGQGSQGLRRADKKDLGRWHHYFLDAKRAGRCGASRESDSTRHCLICIEKEFAPITPAERYTLPGNPSGPGADSRSEASISSNSLDSIIITSCRPVLLVCHHHVLQRCRSNAGTVHVQLHQGQKNRGIIAIRDSMDGELEFLTAQRCWLEAHLHRAMSFSSWLNVQAIECLFVGTNVTICVAGMSFSFLILTLCTLRLLKMKFYAHLLQI